MSIPCGIRLRFALTACPLIVCAACGGEANTSNCSTYTTNQNDALYFGLETYLPKSCPVNAPVPTPTQFAVTAFGRYDAVYPNDAVYSTVYNPDGNLVGTINQARWQPVSYDRYQAQMSGAYQAGTKGCSRNSNWIQRDLGVVEGFVNIPTPHVSEGRVHLDYSGDCGGIIMSNASPLPYESFSVTATMGGSNVVYPAVYNWYVNGAPYGSGESITMSGGAPGQVFDFHVEMTDATGYSMTAGGRVQVKTCDYYGCNDV